MKKNIKRIYIVEAIILIFILLLKFVILENFYQYQKIISAIFWIILLISLIAVGGFPRDKKYLKNSTIKITIIILLIYFLLSYGIGLFTGFTRTIYSHKLIDIIKNITSPLILITVMELVRYLILSKNPNKSQRIILTILLVLFEMISISKYYDFASVEKIFLFISITLLPALARGFLCTYITYNVSFVPSLLINLAINLYIYIVPILPNFGNYISSVIGIVLPYIMYKHIKHELEYKEKYSIYAKKFAFKFATVTTAVLLLILVVLVSGVFNYQIIAIASDSMNPTYNRGDAIIFKKINPEEIEKNDILVFKQNNTFVTHRVVQIYKSGNEYSFVTKGDNNDDIDNKLVHNEDVIGVVKYIVKYIGLPTVWFNEQN